MLNNIVIAGRFVADPESKQTQSGVDVCNFTLAVDRDYKNGDEKVCDYIPCVCWRGTATFVQKYFSKGRMAIVSGSLQSRKWEDKDGNKRTSWEIQAQNVYFADSKRDSGVQYDSADAKPQFTEQAADESDSQVKYTEQSGDPSDLPF